MANDPVSSLHNVEEADDINSKPEPHPLLKAVSDLAARRKALLESQEEEHLAMLEELKPELQRVFWETWNEAAQSRREAMREAHAEERIRRLQEYFKQERMQPRGLDQLSDEELGGEIDHVIDQERKRSNFDTLPGESERSWRERMEVLHYKVEYVGYMLYMRQLDTKVRYVEGFPANVLAVHPKFMPPSRAESSRVGKCLQCRAKRMKCSHAVHVKYIDKSVEECTRCRRSKEPCIVKRRPGDKDVPISYDWALASRRDDHSRAARAEFEELSDKLWAMRYRDGRIMPMPSWHENDCAENARDQEFEPKTWQSVLEGQPAKWAFSQGRSRQIILA